MAQFDTDLLKEQQIIESLPLEAQGELRKYGCLENIRTAAELHDILLKFRQDYKIPPWHPFTYLMRWYANACEGNQNKPDTLWFNTKFLDPRAFDLHAEIGKQTWVDLLLHVERASEEPVTMQLCVQPNRDLKKAIIWSLITETIIFAPAIVVRKPGCVSPRVPRGAINRFALEGQLKGELSYEATYTVRQYGKHLTRAANQEERPSEHESKRRRWNNSQKQRLSELMRETTDDAVEEPVAPAAAPKLNTDLIPMFEMACIKARELGMDETIKYWKQLIGLT